MKKAFSILEILVALIVVSIISAALAPVITKRLSASNITILGGNGGGGGSTGDGTYERVDCQQISKHCLVCTKEECLECAEGYNITNQGKCELDKKEYVTRTPISQEDCDPYNAHYFEGTCITKVNAGDKVSGLFIGTYAPSINIDGIEIKDVTKQCTTDDCCWQGATATTVAQFPHSSYPGGTRTSCTWGAAKKICEEYNPSNIYDTKGKWHLPTFAQTNDWINSNNNNDIHGSAISKLSKYLGSKGLDLCGGHDNEAIYYGTTKCKVGASCPPFKDGDTSKICRPWRVWAEETAEGATTAYYLDLNNTMSRSSSNKRGFGYSVRCVLDEVFAKPLDEEITSSEIKYPENYETPNTQEDCDQYGAHYFEGTCITKVNAGDKVVSGGKTVFEGPKLSSTGEYTTGKVTDIGIEVISSNNNCTTKTCCWKGGQTSGANATFKPTKYEYSAYDRTLCNWWAANIICKNYGPKDANGKSTLGMWELPSEDDFKNWKLGSTDDLSSSIATFSRFLGSDGLNLCGSHDNANNYGNTKCTAIERCIASYTSTATNRNCRPYCVWGKSTNESVATTTTALNFCYSNDYQTTGNSDKPEKILGGMSTRCVLRKVNNVSEPQAETISPQNPPDGYVAPDSQKDCDQYDAFYFNGTCITRLNAGDKVGSIQGPPLQSPNSAAITPDDYAVSDYGIQILLPGDYCRTKTCCWTGAQTATSCSVFSPPKTKGEYSGCNRTVCDWYAADVICKKYNPSNKLTGQYDTQGLWELPSSDDFDAWKTAVNNTPAAISYTTSTLNPYLGSDGLNFCGSHDNQTTNYGTAKCTDVTKCPGVSSDNENNTCRPRVIWGKSTNETIKTTTTALEFYMNADNVYGNHDTMAKLRGAASVRCLLRWVKDADNEDDTESSNTIEYKAPASQADCEPYKAMYLPITNQSGICILKYNVGDTDIGGPKIHNESNYDDSELTSIKIHALNINTNCKNRHCCWFGQTSTNYSTYTDSTYSGENRTVCTWWAADTACKNHGDAEMKGVWRLPNQTELYALRDKINAEKNNTLNTNISKFIGNKGLDLCSSHESALNYGFARCNAKTSCTMNNGNASHNCYPYCIWGAETSTSGLVSTAYQLYINSSVSTVATVEKREGGKSVRCVADKIPKN